MTAPAMLRSRIVLTLIAVIVPTFVLVTLLQNRFAEPLLQNEIQQIGNQAAKNLIGEIEKRSLLNQSNRETLIEKSILELIYSQPNINSIEVKIPTQTPDFETIASSLEYHDLAGRLTKPKSIQRYSEIFENEYGDPTWLIVEPILIKNKTVGIVEVEVSTRLVHRILETIRKLTFLGAFFSILILVFLLNYFLKKSIERDQKFDWISKRLYETERRLLQSEKLSAMGQLTASLAHEVGTPLTSLTGHLQLLREELPPSNHTRINIIESQALKIGETIKYFLQSTRQPVSHRSAVDILQVAQQVIELMQPRLDQYQIQISVRTENPPQMVQAVPLEIEHILLNLINNSIDAIKGKAKQTPDLERKIQIELRFSEQMELTIRDTGCGISEEDLPKVFEPFFTTKQIGEGTGLGLSIIHDWVRKNHGTIHINSEKDSWTEVKIVFPYQS